MKASMIPLKPAKQPLYLCYRSAMVKVMATFIAALIATIMTIMSAQAVPVDTAVTTPLDTNVAADGQTDATLTSAALAPTLAMQRQPVPSALSAANQKLVSENVSLQRQVDDLQTQVNVLIYESKGQLFMYGAMTALLSLALGAFISWLVFRSRTHW